MNAGDVEYIADLVRRTSGLALKGDKAYLVESRLSAVAREVGFASPAEMIGKMRAGEDPAVVEAITEAMTTNETFFFRDKTPFAVMEESVLPYIARKTGGRGKVRVWTAAASTGQEPYSLAILLREQASKLGSLHFEILGTDISKRVLSKAQSGIYTQFEVQRGLSMQRLVKNFDKSGEVWQVKPELRAMATFREFNLLEDFRSLGAFDVVFCRNVLIYFDAETKRDVLERIARLMPEDGFLFLGSAETVVGITRAFKPVAGCRGLYSRSDVSVPACQAA
ncbi:MAG: protein-glutamate O-methyltransferase CheR [Pseudomonadota bacterium]